MLKHRVLAFTFAFPTLMALGCSSSGDGALQGPALQPQINNQDPAFNGSQPGSSTLNPSSGSIQPPTNPNQPVSTTQPPPGSSTGTGGFSCDTFCAQVAACVQDCQSRCGQLVSTFNGPCGSEASALLTCALAAGLHCSDTGKLRVNTDACASLADAWDSCFSANFPDGGGNSCQANINNSGTTCSTVWTGCGGGHVYTEACNNGTCVCITDNQQPVPATATSCATDPSSASADCGWNLP